ncbi:MAG: hypothetical protein PHU12_00360 [Candidatus Aenigmarchaeota archaeon]|nr:hypothetical protein [Candidatus Aenigmarchaeota archaeon]
MTVSKKNVKDHIARYLKSKGVPENILDYILKRGLKENGMQSYNELIEGDKSSKCAESFAKWLEKESLFIDIGKSEGISENFIKDLSKYSTAQLMC